MVKSVVKTFCRCFLKRVTPEKVSVFKGFQRFRKLTAGNCLHAPKPPALSTAPRPDLFNYTTNNLFLQVVKSVVKPLLQRILRESRVPKKPMFTRVFSVFRDFIMRGRCLAPKRRALPIAPHLDCVFLIL